MQKVLTMTPRERHVHQAATLANVEEALREARSATSEEIEEADAKLAVFKTQIIAERMLRGAEPLYNAE